MYKREAIVLFFALVVGCRARPRLVLLFLGGFAVSCGCAKTKPILVIDDWWNVDFAKMAVR